MSVLQKLITKFSTNKNNDLYARMIREIQNADMLWIAFSENSNNFLVGNEKGMATAYIFSEKEFYEQYRVHMEQKGKKISVAENPVRYRMALFGDLYRCGFDRVGIDNGQHYISLDLFEIIKKPEPQTRNKQARFIVNPDLMRTANFIFQEKSRDNIDGKLWQILFSEIFKAEYILPADTKELKIADTKGNEISVTKDSKIYFPVLENKDGKKYHPFFTDWNEYRKYDPETKFTLMAAGFRDMGQFTGTADGIVINPFGVNIILEKDMLETIAKAADELQKETSTISVGEPREYPLEMVRKISEALWDKEYIKAAYLKVMLKNKDSSYLVALEGDLPERPAELYNEIAENALPATDHIPIDFIDYSSDFARKVFKDSRPFYSSDKRSDKKESD